MDLLNGGNFLVFQKSKFGGTNTICCIKLFVETFGVMAKVQSKYNVIILKFKTHLKLQVDLMKIVILSFKILLDFYIILLSITLLKNMKNRHLR
jgi:hypothetical protein